MKKALIVATALFFLSCNDASLRKFNKIFNVADYGADPSGIKDSYPAFTAAMKDAACDGGEVFIPEGKYYFSKQRQNIDVVNK